MGTPGHYEKNTLPYTSNGVTLVASGARGTDGSAVIGGLGPFGKATFVLEVTDVTETGDASDTLEVFIQRLLPNGEWDDFVSFTVVDAADSLTLTFVADVFPGADGDVYAAEASDAELTAATVKNVHWYGDIRVKWILTTDNDEEFTFAVYGMFRA